MTDSSDPPAESSGQSRERRPVVIGPNRRSGSVGQRVHIAALQAQLDSVAAERDRLERRTERLESEREQLEAEVRTLESRVAELDGRCSVLERAIEYKDSQRQQVIDNYERRLAEREAAADNGPPAGRDPLLRVGNAVVSAVQRGSRQIRETLGRLGSVPGR